MEEENPENFVEGGETNYLDGEQDQPPSEFVDENNDPNTNENPDGDLLGEIPNEFNETGGTPDRGGRRTSLTTPGGSKIIPLSAEIVANHISLLARTGNGLSHAFTKLEIHGQGITNLDLLEHYPHLRYLDLSDNSLNEIDSLSSLEYLLSIDLHGNKLKSIPAALDKRKYLQQANFAKNDIMKIEVVNWPMLGWLNLSENRLTQLKLEEFGELLHLEARANKLKHTGKINAPKIQRLYLAQNQIEKIIELEDKYSLLLIHLRDNQISDLSGFSERMKSLSYINLRGNLVASFDEVGKLAILPTLKALILQECPITQLSNYRLEVIMRLLKLERLDKEMITYEEREEANQYRIQLENTPKQDNIIQEE